MKNGFVSVLLFLSSLSVYSQANKTAYVDVYHILKKSPEYNQATLELEKRAKEWQDQIAKKKVEIGARKDALSTERALLTQQLIDEKEDEILLLQKELNDLEYDKFGVDGAYFKQKENIYKPILDQIHTISNDIAQKKRLDFVLLKDEDNAMIYANKRSDITELVIKEIERSRTRSKMSKKEIEQLEIQDKIEEVKDKQRSKRDELRERQKLIEEQNYSNNFVTTDTSNDSQIPNNETALEKKLRLNKEKALDLKQKQQEIRDSKLKKIEEQKIAIKQKQEEAKAAREKAIQDALNKKNNVSKNESSVQKELTPEQLKVLQIREQKAKEAKIKREQVLLQRKATLDKRKKEVEEAKQKRLKEIQERKQNQKSS